MNLIVFIIFDLMVTVLWYIGIRLYWLLTISTTYAMLYNMGKDVTYPYFDIQDFLFINNDIWCLDGVILKTRELHYDVLSGV